MNNKEFKALLKTVKFPGGQLRRVTEGNGTHIASWTKRHGHAEADTIALVRHHALVNGFTYTSGNTTSDATGDRVGHGNTLVKGDVTIMTEAYYGVTSYDNRFFVRVVCKAPVEDDNEMERSLAGEQ